MYTRYLAKQVAELIVKERDNGATDLDLPMILETANNLTERNTRLSGSTTASICSLNQKLSIIQAFNLGDSAIFVFRPSLLMTSLSISLVYRSEPLTYLSPSP